MRKTPPYRTPEEQRALFPDISGNAVNGRGERAPRRPSPLFWHYGVDIPHKALQDYYMQRFEAFPELQDFHLKYGGRGARKPPEKPATPETDTPEAWSRRVKECALASEGDLVGIARVDPGWVFEGYEAPEPWIVVIGVAMDHEELAKAPAIPAAVETMTQYNRGTRAARAVANFIQGAGYHARPHGGPAAGPLTLIPAAIEAGLGELGKHGSMINRSYGSPLPPPRAAPRPPPGRRRGGRGGVLTALPLVADGRDVFGADDFCTLCRVCTDACPPDAISRDRQWVRGVERWYVDFDKCIPYFNDTQGCGICIAVCPWSRTGTAPKLAEKMTRRRRRLDDPD